jgi:hypothetical protein
MQAGQNCEKGGGESRKEAESEEIFPNQGGVTKKEVNHAQ